MRVLVQKSKNDLHLLYSQIFINSFSQLHIPILGQLFKTFRGILCHFSIAELVVKGSRSTQGHHLNNLGSTRVSMLYIPSNKTGCWSKSCLMVFTIYGHGSYLGRVTQLISKLPYTFIYLYQIRKILSAVVELRIDNKLRCM